MKSLHDLRIALHQRHLATLSVFRFVQSRPFEEAYQAATELEREAADKFIEASDKDGLVRWVRNRLTQNNLLEIIDMRSLRLHAQKLKIRNYATLTRLQLISSINYRSKALDENSALIKS